MLNTKRENQTDMIEDEYIKAIKIFRLQCNFYDDITLAYKSLNKKNQEIIIKKFPNLLMDDNKRRKRNKDKKSYYSVVWNHTEKNSKYLHEIERRGFRKYDIDHIVPISYGYKNKIPPELIGNIENLRVITNKENILKGDRITKESEIILESWRKRKLI